MKPNSHSKNFTRNGAFPLTDSNYQVGTMPNLHGGCARHEFLSFRDISGEYFRKEARGDFQREFIAFAAIAVTAAVPLLSNAHALAQFLRAIGNF